MFLITNGSEIISLSYREKAYEETQENYIVDGNQYYDKVGFANLGFVEITEKEFLDLKQTIPVFNSNKDFFNSYEVIEGQVVKKKDFALQLIRIERDKRLQESDTLSCIMFPDVWDKKDADYKFQWLEYRQKLRDLPNSYSVSINYNNVIWPMKPEFKKEIVEPVIQEEPPVT